MAAKKIETVDMKPGAPARIVKRVARPVKDFGPRTPAGTYRVIHGVVTIPRPVNEWMRADGTEIPHEAKFVEATVVIHRDAEGNFLRAEGDEVELNEVDATNLMRAGVIERLDANPSRAGYVFDPEATHMTPRQVRPKSQGNGSRQQARA